MHKHSEACNIKINNKLTELETSFLNILIDHAKKFGRSIPDSEQLIHSVRIKDIVKELWANDSNNTT